jgi:hypothetical protein
MQVTDARNVRRLLRLRSGAKRERYGNKANAEH